MSNRKTQGWIGWFLLIALCIVLHWVPTTASETTSSHNNTTTTNNSTSHNTNTNSHGNNNNSHNAPLEPALAVIFPWFSEIVGVIVFFILSRYLRRLPYTAVLFIIGTFMGVGAHRLERTDQLTESILMWSGINSEVLLLVFLPGLIFRDAYSLNVHLFLESINQILVFAFPMVLAGTTLTALVAFYVFPYNWTFNLSMTFGSILAATDPVAVASLLDEVGAPPRLKIHIAGESLLNDGSAVVFFAIFSGLFLLELGVDGLGTHVDLATGIELFCRMALGGACIGTVFGAGLVQILAFFKRRLSQEENVVEVTATITIAYLTYYTAEVAWGTSGVLATVFCGVTTKAFGESLVNDKELLHNFWVLVEHLLNSLIFVLGGTVWGAVIVQPPNRDGQFEARDWGYLLLLYVLVTAIRFLLFFCAFPLTRRLGLKTNWRETFFTSYGGLRGAVGIALALSLDNRVIEATEPGSLYRHFTTKVFGMVGGVALLTLVVNGLTAGPLLIHLGLSEETATRHKVLENYKRHLRREILDDVVRLLTQRRFHRVNFSIVRHHIKQLATLTRQELDDAVERHRQTVPEHMYQEPYLDRMYPFLMDDEETGEGRAVDGGGGGDGGGVGTMDKKTTYESHRLVTTSMDCEADDNDNNDNNNNTTSNLMGEESEKAVSPEALKEFRLIFVSLLRAAYQKQVKHGELAENEGFLSFILFQGLDFAEDEINNGGPISDWAHSQVVPCSIKNRAHAVARRIKHMPLLARFFGGREESKHSALQFTIHRALAILSAHVWAQARFRAEFESDFSGVQRTVLAESNQQIQLAHDVLVKKERKDVHNLISNIFCSIVLNNAAEYIEKMADVGLLRATEAEEYLEEITEELTAVQNCPRKHHGDSKHYYDDDDDDEEEELRFY